MSWDELGPRMLEALRPLAAWAENERRAHLSRDEFDEAEYMGKLADSARSVIVEAEEGGPSDLLEALRWALDEIGESKDSSTARATRFAQARHALARAEGRS